MVGSLLNRSSSPELRNSPLNKMPAPRAVTSAKRKLCVGGLDTNNNGKDVRANLLIIKTRQMSIF